jgi:hypothetical protein
LEDGAPSADFAPSAVFAHRTGVVRADRSGTAWTTSVVLPDEPVRCLAPAADGVVWAGTQGHGALRSDDAGASRHQAGLEGRIVKALAPSPHDSRVVYAGLKPPGVVVTRDGGETWTSPPDAPLGHGWACAADPGDPDTVSVSAASGPGRAHGSKPAEAVICRSRSGGPRETLAGGLPTPLDAMPYALITDPEVPGHLYAGLADGTVWLTADHGDAWHRLDVDLGAIERSVVAIWT